MVRLLNENSGTEDIMKDAALWKQQIWAWLTDTGMWTGTAYTILKVVIIILITRIGIRLMYRLIDRTMEQRKTRKIMVNSRRMTTIGELLKNVITVVFNFLLIMLVLSQLGINLAPLIAGAGVIGLAVGFGAQSLVKDIITGFFIIFEDQFAVGDVVETGAYKGTVELIGLRTTRLIGWRGEVYIIPNGMITAVTNYSMSNSLAVVDLPVKAERTLQETVNMVNQALEGIQDRNPLVISEPEVLGVQSMNTSEYIIRIVAECQPNTRSEVERDIITEVKKSVEQEEAMRQALLEQAASREQ